MSPRHKPHHPSPTPRDRKERNSRKSPITATTTTTPFSRPSSIPTLPDVHKAPSGGPHGNFLQTLLAEEQVEREGEEDNEEVGEVGNARGEGGRWTITTKSSSSSSSSSISSSRSEVVTKPKGKIVQEGHGHRLKTSDRSTKSRPGDTLTARSDKILTATWSDSGEPEDQGGLRRRRRSRDAGSTTTTTTTTTRRLSGGPVSSKKKLKHRLAHSYDVTQEEASYRLLSSPAASGWVGSPKAASLTERREDRSDVLLGGSSSSSASARPASGSTTVPWAAGECVLESAHGPTAAGKLSPAPTKISADSDASTSYSHQIPSDLEKKQTLQMGKAHHTEKTASESAAGVTKLRDSHLTSFISGSTEVTATALTPASISTYSTEEPTPSTKATARRTPEPSEAFNQWTTCRALGDTDDENDNENDDDDNDDDDVESPGPSRTSEAETRDLHNGGYDGYSHAANSSHLARRKRPLLLPPIMLPPLYTVKPTPFKFRDEVYFAGAASRARRPISDEEWDKLRDCRYLRIRTLRRHLKV
ncbi:uncharacterized protein LOC143293705 [Babylonia areolata]|uniref:uncharacterized protein LOC143293705 n=1 Tax=Babylonia areolata TaxID=304850 RepID=UPI003FD107BF